MLSAPAYAVIERSAAPFAVNYASIRKRFSSRSLLYDPSLRHVGIPSFNWPTRPCIIALRAFAGLAST